MWPNRPVPNYNAWKQTSNPVPNLLDDNDDLSEISTTVGYEAIDVHYTDHHWGGLERSHMDDQGSLLTGPDGHYFAIGMSAFHGAGFLGPDDVAESVVELYADCPGVPLQLLNIFLQCHVAV